MVELTFIFLCVTFRGSPGVRSSFVITKVTDSVDSARPIHYSTFDVSPPPSVPSPSPPFSLTNVHRIIGTHNPNRHSVTNCMTTEMDLLSAHPPRPYPPHSRMYYIQNGNFGDYVPFSTKLCQDLSKHQQNVTLRTPHDGSGTDHNKTYI